MVYAPDDAACKRRTAVEGCAACSTPVKAVIAPLLTNLQEVVTYSPPSAMVNILNASSCAATRLYTAEQQAASDGKDPCSVIKMQRYLAKAPGPQMRHFQQLTLLSRTWTKILLPVQAICSSSVHSL